MEEAIKRQAEAQLEGLSRRLGRTREIVTHELLSLATARQSIDMEGNLYSVDQEQRVAGFSGPSMLGKVIVLLGQEDFEMTEIKEEHFGEFLEKHFQSPIQFFLKSNIPGLTSVFATAETSAFHLA